MRNSIQRIHAGARYSECSIHNGTVYRADMADMADYAAMNAVWNAWVVPGNPPGRATVQAPLALGVSE